MASQYYRVAEDVVADGVGPHHVTSRRWFKLGLALSGVSCLVLVSLVAASASTSKVESASAAKSIPPVESIDLIGVPPSFRSPFGGATKSSNANRMGLPMVERRNPATRASASWKAANPGAAKSSISKLTGPPMVRAATADLSDKPPDSEGSDMNQAQTLSDGVGLNKLPNGERVYTFSGLKSVNPIAKLQMTEQFQKDFDKFSTPVSPVEKLAVAAVGAAQSEDSAVKDELKNELSNMDDATKAQVAKVQEAVRLKAQDMAGVTSPLGFFDPLGFSSDVSEGKLLFYREVEVKHGRVAMLAALGFLVAEQFHPLFGGDIDVPSYIAFQQTPLQTFWPAVLAAIAIPEIVQINAFNSPFTENGEKFSIRSDRIPGDFGFDPLGLKPTNSKELKEMQTKEINNGRLAMIAAAGMVAQELATGQKIF